MPEFERECHQRAARVLHAMGAAMAGHRLLRNTRGQHPLGTMLREPLPLLRAMRTHGAYGGLALDTLSRAARTMRGDTPHRGRCARALGMRDGHALREGPRVLNGLSSDYRASRRDSAPHGAAAA